MPVSSNTPSPWPVPPPAVGLVLWLFRAPAPAASLEATQPDRCLAGEEAPRDPGSLKAILDSASSAGTWAVELSAELLPEVLQHLLGLPPSGARALEVEPGHGVQLRADGQGWTLERSNIADPGRAHAADLGDGISE